MTVKPPSLLQLWMELIYRILSVASLFMLTYLALWNIPHNSATAVVLGVVAIAPHLKG